MDEVALMTLRGELVGNDAANKFRYDTLEGRKCIVVPCAAMAEGVWEGTNGAIYYPSVEHQRAVSSWNHRPVVIYHPELNGKPISACDPVILNSQKVGVTLNTVYNNKLRPEVWFDEVLLMERSRKTYDAVLNNQMVEVSTGLGLDLEMTPGTWEGKSYVGIARNHRPDHLAILPDKIGAYSIKDGAGLMQNNERKEIPLIENEMSFDEISCAIADALCAKYGEPGKSWCGWILGVYTDYVVFYDDGDYYMQDYTSSDAGITLVGDAVKVNRVVEYVTESGQTIGNTKGVAKKTVLNKGDEMTKKEMIAKLVANGGFNEPEDQAFLGTLPEGQLKKMVATLDKVGNQTPAPTPEPTPAPTPTPAPVVNASTITFTPDQWLAACPAEIKVVMNEAIEARNTQKAEAIAAIVANGNSEFDETELKAMPLPTLRKLAKALTKSVASVDNWMGAFTSDPITANAGAGSGDALVMPSMWGG